MNGRIVIDVQDDGDNLGITVDVSGSLNTLEAIGLFEIAKEQHRASKLTGGPAIYQTPDTPDE